LQKRSGFTDPISGRGVKGTSATRILLQRMLSSPDETAIPRVGFSLAMPANSAFNFASPAFDPASRSLARSKQPLLDKILEPEETNRQRAQRDRFELGYWL
jgi:hypothetical protein